MVYGETLTEEIKEAGLGNKGIVVWNESEDIKGTEKLTNEEKLTLQEVINNHDNTKKNIVEKSDLEVLKNLLINKKIISEADFKNE